MEENNNNSKFSKFYLFAFIAILIAFCMSFQTCEICRGIFDTLFPGSKHGSAFSGKLFTKEELSKYTGEDGSSIYMALRGEVYDVTKGRRHYGVGGGYHFFSGKDATRAFVSGDFKESGLREDVDGLSNSNMLGIKEWLEFYEKDYKHIGRLVGLYYDADGQETDAMRDYRAKIEVAESEKQREQDDRNIFPPCNSEYRQGVGKRFWCSNLSGGIQRDWVGVPRKYFKPGTTQPRCACVKSTGAPSGKTENIDDRGDIDNPSFKEYEDCDALSFECRFSD